MHYYIDCTPQWSPHSSPLALRRSQAELNNPQCTEAVCTTYCKSGNDIAEPKGAMWRGVQEKPAIVLSTSWMFPKMSMPRVLLCIYCVEKESWLGILTKLSLKLPITTVNGRSSAECWLLAATRQILPALTLQCCRALLQPPGGVGGWGWLVLAAGRSILVSQCPSQVQPAARLQPRTFVFSRQ